MLEVLDIRWFLLCRWLAVRRERAQMAVAWGVPRWLAYWCAIRVFAHATTGQYGDTEAPGLTIADALKRWDS